MATKEEILAAIAKAETAGDTAGANVLRGYLAKMEVPDIGKVMAAQRKALEAGDVAGFNTMAAYLKRVAPPVMNAQDGPATPPPVPAGGYEATPRPVDTFGETAAAAMEGPVAAMGAFGGGLIGGPSPSRDYLNNDPFMGQAPGWLNAGLGFVGDLGGAALSTAGAGIAGGLGLASELVPGQNSQDEGKLTQDLMGMAMFAVPELAGVSSLAGRAATVGGRGGATLAPAIPARAAPEVAQVGALIGDAAKASAKPGGKRAAAIAADAAPDQATIAAAERLGFDLPADVYATNTLIRTAAGGARGMIGSAEQGSWINTIVRAAETADDAMRKIADTDLSVISEQVSTALADSHKALRTQAGKLYDQVEKSVPATSPSRAPRAVAMINDRATELGGVGKLPGNLSAIVRELSAKTAPTYARLLDIKQQLANTAFGAVDLFPGLDKSMRRRIVGALSEDIVDAATAVGGDEIRAALRLANQITAKYKGIESRITEGFGKDGFGSIATKLRTAISTAAKGNAAGLNKLLRIVPDDLKADALGSAISSLSRAKGGVAKAGMNAPDLGGFGFAEFGNVYRGLRGNGAVWKTIGDALGKEATDLMGDLYRVSKAITDARANVSTTGASLTFKAAVPLDLLTKVLSSKPVEAGARAATVAAGAATGGPLGAAMAAPLASLLSRSSPDYMAAMGNLFRSPEFMALMKDQAKKSPQETLKVSRPFQAFLKAAGKSAEQFFSNEATVKVVPAAVAQQQDDYESLYGRY